MDMQWRPLDDLHPALKDLYERWEGAYTAWADALPHILIPELSVSDVTHVVVSYAARVLYESVGHLTPASPDTMPGFASQQANELLQAMLGLIMAKRPPDERGVYLPVERPEQPWDREV